MEKTTKVILWRRSTRYFLCLLLASVILLVLAWSTPAQAGADSVEITGDGVKNPVTLTWSQLQEMEQYEAVYSSINTWPTKKWYVGKGVKISDLLERAGISDSAKLIKFSAQDGYTLTLTVDEVLKAPRYYFPNLKSNSENEGNIPGSKAGAQPVETMLSLVSAEGSDNPKYMDDVNSLLLMIGQRSVTEQTGNLFVKFISKIEVSNSEPERWDAPQANPTSGVVIAGTMVTLSNANSDDDKIYYTTDGSEPDMDSEIYNWIAKRWWAARSNELGIINHPIGPINETTTIKAITIGAGKLDSEAVTFTYVISEEEAEPTSELAGSASSKVIKLTIGQRSAFIGGSPYTLDVAPYINAEAQRTLVPLRFISEALGAAVEWCQESSQIVIFLQDKEIILTPGINSVTVNGADMVIDCPPEIQPPGVTFVPLRFISETLGASVVFDQESNTVTIIK